MTGVAHVRVAAELRALLPLRHRRDDVAVVPDRTSTVGHVITSLGVPLTEVGEISVGGSPVPRSYRPAAVDVVAVGARARPQAAPTDPPRFLLDVHLGALARRLRLLGVDAAYRNDLDDEELVEQAQRERRVLLSRDRGLLRRSAVRHGGFVRGDRPDDQLADVLDRFAPPLAPWTRCTVCNGRLVPVPKAEVLDLLQPGTRRSYDEFARCVACRRVFWPGAHSARLRAIVSAAQARVSPGPGSHRAG